MNLFLTGTDTGVGKTYVAALLVRALRQAGIDAVGMKPICCGDRADAEILHEAAGGVAELSDINPVWLRTPAAPYVAAMIEGRIIDLALIREAFERLRSRHQALIVEGVGGWMVPITREYYIRDLAAELGLPVAIVVGNRLGALNHALLTIEAVRNRGLTCAGVVLNAVATTDEDQIATATNRAILETLSEAPILFEITRGQKAVTLGVG